MAKEVVPDARPSNFQLVSRLTRVGRPLVVDPLSARFLSCHVDGRHLVRAPLTSSPSHTRPVRMATATATSSTIPIQTGVA